MGKAFGVWVGGSSPGVITRGSSTTLALPLGIEISRIFTGGHVESHQIVCEDFIEELPEKTRGFFDFLKRKKDKPKKKSKKIYFNVCLENNTCVHAKKERFRLNQR